MSKKEEEQIKQAGALARARTRRGPAARRAYNDKVNDSGSSIDSLREHSGEQLALYIATSIEKMLNPAYCSDSFLRRATDRIEPYLRRLQDSHRSHAAKQQHTALFERKRLIDLAANIPTQDDPPLVRELWEKRLRELAGLPIEKEKK